MLTRPATERGTTQRRTGPSTGRGSRAGAVRYVASPCDTPERYRPGDASGAIINDGRTGIS